MPDGSLLWTFEYSAETGSDAGDEQVALSDDGALIFQRDTFEDADESVVNFGLLIHDVLFFLVFANRFAVRAGATGEVVMTLSVRAPPSARGTLAMFSGTTVDHEQPHRVARLSKWRTEVTGSARVEPSSVEHVGGLATAAKRLLDRVANEFTLAASALGGTPNFMVIGAPALRKEIAALEIPVAERPSTPTAAADRPELTVRFETKSMGRDSAGTVVVHHYELVARFTNTTKRRLDDWYIEVELPTPLLEPSTTYLTLVRERSDAERSVFRTSKKLRSLASGDHYEWKLPYRVDDKLFWSQPDVLKEASAVARAFIDGALVAETILSRIQNF